MDPQGVPDPRGRRLLPRVIARLLHVGNRLAARLPRVPGLQPNGLANRLHHPKNPQPIEQGLVSTIVPVYNRGAMATEAIQSVLRQTYESTEVIVVDDGSTDDTSTLCADLARKHRQVRYMRIPHCGLAGLVREAGRAVARGEYIQYLDSDDLLAPRKFEVMTRALREHPERDIAYCLTRRYHVDQEPRDEPDARTGVTHTHLLPGLLSQRYWCTSTPLYTRRVCDLVGPWSGLPVWEDLEYDVRMGAQGALLVHCQEFLTDIRDHDAQRLSPAGYYDRPECLRLEPHALAAVYAAARQTGVTPEVPEMQVFLTLVQHVEERCRSHGLLLEAETCSLILDESRRSA